MSRTLPRGVVLNGYRIERALSEEGNFAVVYLAYDTNAARVARRGERIAGRIKRWGDRYGPVAGASRLDPGPYVALKEYIPRLHGIRRGMEVTASSSEKDREIFAWGLERMKRESSFLAEHSHPNVVAVYDLFTANNTAYYVMERLTGGSLETLVAQNGPQTEAQIRRWLTPLLDGVASVERQNASHLDIAPGNIVFRTPGAQPVLIDFGVARISGAAPTHGSRIVVDPNFAAPEKYHRTSSKLDTRSDIYSIGGVVNYALTGELPPSGLERQAGQASFSEAGKARRVEAASSAFLKAIDKAFETDADHRFRDAQAFAESLSACAPRAPAPVHTPPSPSPEPQPTGGRLLRKGDGLILILGGIALFIVVAIAALAGI